MAAHFLADQKPAAVPHICPMLADVGYSLNLSAFGQMCDEFV
jgi:hypothetical protein